MLRSFNPITRTLICTLEGATLPIFVAATDDVAVAAVNLLVNGIPVSTDTAAPYQFTLTVPTGVSSLTLGAAAGDVGSNMGTAQDVVVPVIPDPLTTVIGRILAQGGNPVAGATVTCADVSGLTGADGTFSIPAVPTLVGAIRRQAVFVTPQGETLGGFSPRAVFPGLGGVTDVGDLIASALTTGPRDGTVADLNGDDVADVVVANSGTNDVSVLLGNGDGTFQLQQLFAVALDASSVAIADLNGDSASDVVMASSGGRNSVSVLLGNGDGTFQAPRLFATGTCSSVAVVDLNSDTIVDLVTANNLGNVSVLLGNGDGTFRPEQRFAADINARFVAVADLNGDGAPDVVTTSSNGRNSVSVLLGNGDGTFQPEQRFAAGVSPSSVAAADFNGDGDPDLVTANVTSADVSVLLHQ